MHRTFSDPAVYGGGLQEHGWHRGSFETSENLLTQISQRKFEASEYLHHPIHRITQGNRLSLGFLPTQLEESLSRRKVLLGDAYQGTPSYAQAGNPDYKSTTVKTSQGGASREIQGGVKLENPENPEDPIVDGNNAGQENEAAMASNKRPGGPT